MNLADHIAVADATEKTLRANRDEWLAARKQGIGGSDCASMFNVGWGCRRRLWYDKTDTPSDFERESTKAMKLGQLMEPFWADEYAEATRRGISESVARVHPTIPTLRVNPDRMIHKQRPGNIGLTIGVLEIKSMGRAAFYHAKHNGLAEDYVLQLQHAMVVTGATWGSFAIGSRDSGELLWWDVEADPDIHAAILEEGPRFWSLVEAGIAGDATTPPEALEPDDKRCQTCAWRVTCQGNALAASCERLGNEYTPDESLAPLVREYIERRDVRKEAQDAFDGVKAELEAKLGDRTMVAAGGAKVQFYTIHKDTYSVPAHDERPLRVYPPKGKR